MANPLNIFKKNRVLINTLVQDTIDYTVDKFKQSLTNFTVASAYGQIIFVIENLAQMILYYIEDSITELNINTATRTNSVLGLASLAGHNPTRAISASGEIGFRIKSAAAIDISGGTIIIPNYTKIKCVNNGVTYILNLPSDDLRVATDGSRNGITANILQGAIETQTFTGTGRPLQSVSINFPQSVLIDHFNVNVTVNGEKWKKYDALYDIPRNGKGYLVKTGIISGIDVFFGNGFAGLMPELGSEILVEYLVTSGELGNISLSEGDTAFFQWEETGFNIYGDEVDLNEMISVSMVISPDFGTNPEPIELTRLVAPKTSRSFTLHNPESYIVFLEKFNVFSIIDAFYNENIPDNNIIYLFLVPDIRKKMSTSENYFTVDESRFMLTQAQKNKINNLIDRSGSKIATTEQVLVDPTISRYVLNIALITTDYHTEDSIRQSIIQKLSDYFISIRRRDRIPKSDLK